MCWFSFQNIPHSIRGNVGYVLKDFTLNRDSNVVSDATAA